MISEQATVKVLMSRELMEKWASRDSEGRLLTWSWGEPDADGFHTPVITTHDDDRLGELDRAWAEAEAALPERWSITLTRYPAGTWPVNASAWNFEGGVSAGQIEAGRDTPAAALRALAVKLRAVR